MPVNTARGEVELELDGRSYTLRPSFETLSAIEDGTGLGAFELIQQIRLTTITMKNIVVVLWLASKGNKANGKVPSVEKFGELIRRGPGFSSAGLVALGFLSSSISTDEQMKDAADQAEGGDTKDADPSEPSEESKLAEDEPDPTPTE